MNRNSRLILSAVFAIGAASSSVAAEKTVKASSFGYDPLNATRCLQKAIDSGAATVIVDAAGSDWCIEPIRLRSDLELVFARGVHVRSVPGAFKSTGSMMFVGRGVTNVTIRGEEGASVSMLKRDYLGERLYKWSEWRHMFAFYQSQGLAISNLAFSASGGDGVYVANCKDVRIENVLVADHNRQGISLIGAENLYIGHSRFCCTCGTPPQCGIDFEPNHGGNSCFVNTVIEDCEFDGNESCGICFHIPNLGVKSPPMSVTFRKCRIRGNGQIGFRSFASWGDPGVGGFISVEDCVFAGNRQGVVAIAAQPHDSLKIAFRNCVFDNRGCDKPAVVFDNGQSAFDFGNVSFEGVHVLSDLPDVFSFMGMTGVGLVNVSGVLKVHLPDGSGRTVDMKDEMAKNRPDPEARAFKPTAVYRKELKPISEGSLGRAEPVFCRGRQHFIQAAPMPGSRKIRFVCRQAGKNTVMPEVTIHDKPGTLVESFKLEKDVTDYVLKSTVPGGMYTFTVNSRGNHCGISSPFPGHGILVDSRAQIVGATGRKYYFLVPARSEVVKMEVFVRRGNPLSARILDGKGKVREEIVKAETGKILTMRHAPTEKEEAWCLDVSEAGGPFEIRLGGGVLAVLSEDPQSLLHYAK